MAAYKNVASNTADKYTEVGETDYNKSVYVADAPEFSAVKDAK
jgi:hypothetical protein